MFDRFSDRARKTMALARKEAQRLQHDFIGTDHILLGLIQVEGSTAVKVLENLGVDVDRIRREIDKEHQVPTGPSMVTMGQLPFSPRAKEALEASMEEAKALKHDCISTGHILLGLLQQSSVAAEVLLGLRLTLDAVRGNVLRVLGTGRSPEAPAAPVPDGFELRDGDGKVLFRAP